MLRVYNDDYFLNGFRLGNSKIYSVLSVECSIRVYTVDKLF
jgi:hypothetical protein